MSDTEKQGELEAARARLETALSTLAHGVAKSSTALETTAALAQEKTALMNRVTALEHENLKLHEQVAAHALMPESPESSAATAENARLKQIIEQMEQDKAAIKGELDKTIGELENMLEDA